ncbi:MAG: hypothetical protein Q7T82_03705 [Armatimonadota bacterium]|nr:hypothetical protein [Armatimonadota bacterium]
MFSLYCPGNEGKGISNCRFGITPRLEAGVGYSWDNSKLLGSANYLIRTEDGNRPDVTLGIGSRRTGGSDSSALLSVGKSLRLEQRAIRLSCGLAYTLKQSDTETMDPMSMEPMPPHRDPKASIVAGASMTLGRSMAGGLQYDGESLHAMLTRRIGTANVSLLLLEMKDVGVSVGYSFSSRSQ